jgi:hypothetical protein
MEPCCCGTNSPLFMSAFGKSSDNNHLLNSILNEPLFPDYFDRNFSGPEWLHGNQCCQDQAIQAVTMPVFLTTLITMFI